MYLLTCAQRRLKSACKSTQYDQSLHCLHVEICTLGYPKCTQWRFWSDCANTQSDLNLLWVHMSECMFSDVAKMISNVLKCNKFLHLEWSIKKIWFLKPTSRSPRSLRKQAALSDSSSITSVIRNLFSSQIFIAPSELNSKIWKTCKEEM